ncbi:hypothetical protein F443_06883, partial [Phytophthora nicotianae P1569]
LLLPLVAALPLTKRDFVDIVYMEVDAGWPKY